MSTVQLQSVNEKLLSLPLGSVVKDFLNYLVVEAGLSENTILAYGRDLTAFLEHCKSSNLKKLNQLKPLVVQKCQQKLIVNGKETEFNTDLTVNEQIFKTL